MGALLLGPVLALIAAAIEPRMSFNAFLLGQIAALTVARRQAKKAPI